MINPTQFTEAVLLKVGEEETSKLLSSLLFEQAHIHVKLSYSSTQKGQTMIWNRDLCVIRPKDGKRVYAQTKDQVFPLPTYLHMFFSTLPVNGGGLFRFSEFAPVHDALSDHLTCIEGGNVLFSRNEEDDFIALVGEGATAFTISLMEKQRKFEHLEIVKHPRGYHERREMALQEMAKILEVESKNLIELRHGIALSEICGIYQPTPTLHVDLEALLVGTKTVLLNDPDLVLNTLKFLVSLNLQEHCKEALVRVTETLFQHRKNAMDIFQENQKRLTDHGFTVIGVPGLFEIDCLINGGQFLNGLYFKGERGEQLLVSPQAFVAGTGAGFRLEEIFYEAMAELNIHVIFAPSDDLVGGGIHCITQEVRPHNQWKTPHAIPILWDRLPKTVSATLHVFLDDIEDVSLLDLQPQESTFISREESSQRFHEKVSHRVKFTVGVPLTTPLRVNLLYKQVLLDTLSLLPGQKRSLEVMGPSAPPSQFFTHFVIR